MQRFSYYYLYCLLIIAVVPIFGTCTTAPQTSPDKTATQENETQENETQENEAQENETQENEASEALHYPERNEESNPSEINSALKSSGPSPEMSSGSSSAVQVSLPDYQPKRDLSPVHFIMLSPNVDIRDTPNTAGQNGADSNTTDETEAYTQTAAKRSRILEKHADEIVQLPEERSAAELASKNEPVQFGPSETEPKTSTRSKREADTTSSPQKKSVAQQSGSTAGSPQPEVEEPKKSTADAGAVKKKKQTPEQDQQNQQKNGEQIEIIRAAEGEQVHITLPEFGWIYDRSDSQSQGVEYLSRNYRSNSTEFVFSAQDIGRYTLSFQQQNSGTGTQAFRRIVVNVSAQRDPAIEQAAMELDEAEKSGRTGSGGSSDASSGISYSPSSGLSSKKNKSILSESTFSFEALKGFIEEKNTTSIAHQLEVLQKEQPNIYELAAIGPTIGTSNFSSIGEADKTAHGSSVRVNSSSDGFGFSEKLSIMRKAGELLYEDNREKMAAHALRIYIESTEQKTDFTGRVLFLLGQIYESPTPPRDERQSVEYYRQIVSFYPTDPYRMRAEERIKYLQRHFLQIR